MNQTPKEDVKAWVRDAYAKTAAGKGSCCGPSCCSAEGNSLTALAERADEIGRQLGYSATDLAAVPEGANLGLGCGNPVALAELQPGQTVLDLGSGAGFDCFLAAQRVGPTGKVIAVDMTQEMLARARANAQKGGYANVEFREGDIEALPLDDASVDVVISNCVLNLVPDKAKAFGEIARVLRPGGHLAVSDIVLTRELPQAIREHPGVYASCIGGAIVKAEYLRLLQEAGFASVEVVDEVDAGGLLTCAPGPVSDLLREHGLTDAQGWALSVKLKAARPDCRRP